MAHRKLNEIIEEFHEFSSENLSEVLSEVALFAAVKEREHANMFLKQEWSEDKGFIIYVFVSY